jgi:hypothetical protein
MIYLTAVARGQGNQGVEKGLGAPLEGSTPDTKEVDKVLY